MVFLLNIFENEFDLGKFFFSILKNNFPVLVFTIKEKGGLKYIIFLLLFLFSLFLVCSSLSLLYFSSSLKSLLHSACLYVLFAVSEISWLHGISVVYQLLWVILLKYLVDGLNVWCELFHCLVFNTVGMYYLLNPNVHQENLQSLNLL